MSEAGDQGKPEAAGDGSRLGFGCSAIVAGRTRRESRLLLDAAWDAGIRHFDTARVYGSGDAEALLGAFAKSRRSEATIVTKFGIQPAASGAGARAARSALRRLVRGSRALSKRARRYSRASNARGRFTAADMRASLTESLRELQCDYVDILLMHDCTADDWAANEETQDAMEGLVSAGRIRFFGTATSYTETHRILTGNGANPTVVQFDSNVQTLNARRIADLGTSARLITYGAIGSLHRRLTSALREQPERCRQWSRVYELDLQSTNQLAALLLAHARWLNPAGVVIFFSGDPKRVAINAHSAHDQSIGEEQLRAFEQFARALSD